MSIKSIPKLLIVIGSYRKSGNCELVARYIATNILKNKKADVKLLNLTGLKLNSCMGCMNCVINRVPCSIRDDLVIVNKEFSDADCILFCMPIYGYFPPAIFKLLLDRRYSATCDVNKLCYKKASIIALGTINKQPSIVNVIFSVYVQFMAFDLVESYIIGGVKGPGSVLIKKAEISKVLEIGYRLIESCNSEIENKCAFCTEQIFQINGLFVQCPLCRRSGKIDHHGNISWLSDGDTMTSRGLTDKFLLSARPHDIREQYKNTLHEIIEKKKQLRECNIDLDWVTKL